jgi:hypothetical protein
MYFVWLQGGQLVAHALWREQRVEGLVGEAERLQRAHDGRQKEIEEGVWLLGLKP